MTKRILAKLMIKCWDFKTVQEFNNLIELLTICLYHTDEVEKAEDIQNAIWYIVDKKQACK